MLRRTGFKRRITERKPKPVYRPVERAGVYGGGTLAAAPKPRALRNPHLLTLARDQDCQLCVPGVCTHDRSTTVSCHSNLAEHGKAGSRKADDQFVVHGCSACHAWLDQGSAGYEEKREVFLVGLDRQKLVWLAIAGDPGRSQRDRDAAAWVLDQIRVRTSG